MEHFCARFTELRCPEQRFYTQNTNPVLDAWHGTLQASETGLSPKEQVKPYYLDLLVTNPSSVLSRSSFLGDTKVEGGGDGLSSVTVFCCVWA